MSASMMRGSDRAAGAVAGVMHTRNPVIAARAVLESYQVLMIGEHAEEFARSRGAEQRPNEYFITERQQGNLARHVEQYPAGTVGAVCLDGSGTLAAATSTGGLTGQPPGRVGDSPVIGAGTWADGVVAVSCTGEAEVAEMGGTGGVIACGADGSVALPFTTDAMPRGMWRAGGEPQVWIT
jgi:beta-aspartyl-peptidase (threonine type)